MKNAFLYIFLFVNVWFFSCRDSGPPLPKTVDFNFHIRPLLSDRCFACHGPDEKKRKADLALHTEERAFAALKDTPDRYAIVPGNVKKSELITRIFHTDPEIRMPPAESNLSLNDYEKRLISKWIEQGAQWKAHWSFIPPRQPSLPRVKGEEWCNNDIDHFILRKMQANAINPSAPAGKAALLRRLSFDLTGLPPSLEEIGAFERDDSPQAYENVVDRLLGSVHFGERMASVWLDAARYADSHGYQDDRQRTMWPWRDWVVKAFNDNLPYDQFITWQIAGDLLPNASYEQKLATGFNRNHAITQEGGVVEEEYLTEYAADRTQTFSTALLGLTMECARCHSHKYDPISQEEYYSLLAFFNNIEGERGQISYFDLSPQPNLQVHDPLLDSLALKVRDKIGRLTALQIQLEENPGDSFSTWASSSPEMALDLQDGLVAYFTLDSSRFVNQIPGHHPGRTNINLPPHIPQPDLVKGKKGKALQFNGANFLSIGELGDFEHHHSFSVGAWIQHSGLHRKKAALWGRRNGEQHQSGYDVVLTPDSRIAARLIAQWRNPDQPVSDQDFAVEVRTQVPIPPNTWVHLMVTYQGSGTAADLKIYLNGKLQPVFTIIDNLQEKSIRNGNDFLIGNWNHRAKEKKNLYGFKGGSVDELRLYNRTLSPVEVAAVYAEKNLAADPKQYYLHYLYRIDPKYRKIREELDSLRALDLNVPKVMVMAEMDTIKQTFVLNRGKYDEPLSAVERSTPQAVLGWSDQYSSNRLGLAQWLFDEANPLTARVMVNRIWQMLFGKGLVITPEDFGSQGALPSHPELLDWLAVHFIQSGWDIKGLLKTIVSSATYRQSAVVPPAVRARDPNNNFYGRGPALRLTAEMLRDQALAASGLLNRKVGGKWVRPYQPPGIWKEMANQIGENKYRASTGMDLYRRSLYSYWKRTIPPPSMLIFDAAERAVCTVKRQETSTPLQSLTLLNDPTYVEASRVLAEQVFQNPKPIVIAFKRITSRTIQPAELQLLQELLQAENQRFQKDTIQAQQLVGVGEWPVNTQLDQVKLAALTTVINTIFNLDESKYR